MENPIKMDDLGGKPTIFGIIRIHINCVLQTLSQIDRETTCSGSRPSWISFSGDFVTLCDRNLSEGKWPQKVAY